MKIKLSSNFNIESILANLNIKSGFTLYKLDDSNFSNKLLKNLTTMFPQTYNIVTENVIALIKASNYINTYLGEELSTPINLQLHASSSITKAYNSLYKKVSSNTHENNEYDMAYAQPSLNKISIGLDIFRKKDENSLIHRLSENINKQTAARLVFFHELGHMLEHKQTSKKNQYFSKIEDKIDFLQTKQVKILNENLTQQLPNKRFGVLDTNFIELLHSLSREIYADTASLLFERNYNLVEQTYCDKNFNNIINILYNCRVDAYKNTTKLFFDNVIDNVKATQLSLLHATHLTSIGLQDLKETIATYSEKWSKEIDATQDGIKQEGIKPFSFTSQQIHQICKKQVEKGITKFIYILDKYTDVFQPQINTLINATFNNITHCLESLTDTSVMKLEVEKIRFFAGIDKNWKNVVEVVLKNLPPSSTEEKVLNLLDATLDTNNMHRINLILNNEHPAQNKENSLQQISHIRSKNSNLNNHLNINPTIKNY